jgi:hypothetical protein
MVKPCYTFAKRGKDGHHNEHITLTAVLPN